MRVCQHDDCDGQAEYLVRFTAGEIGSYCSEHETLVRGAFEIESVRVLRPRERDQALREERATA